MDESYSFYVEVTVGSDVVGAQDEMIVSVASDGDGTHTAVDTVWAESAGTPLSVPFIEHFDEDVFNLDRWTPSLFVPLTDDALYDPAEGPQPYFVEYRSEGSQVAIPLKSQQIDIFDYDRSFAVVYSYECTGNIDSPEEGDLLLVEYVDPEGAWHVLDMQAVSYTHLTLPTN